MAHAAEAGHRAGVDDRKLEAVCDYRTSPLFSEAERVALDFAVAAASQPNAASEELFARMRQHWSEAQIVEIAGAVALNGFLNRWNDTMAPQLEREPLEFGERHLTRHGWSAGKHRQ
jgi:alkylhydroperoxidase family enzyme